MERMLATAECAIPEHIDRPRLIVGVERDEIVASLEGVQALVFPRFRLERNQELWGPSHYGILIYLGNVLFFENRYSDD